MIEKEERIRRRHRRTTRVSEIIEFLEYLAPPAMASPSQPHGLQTGSASAPVRTVVVSPMASYNALSTAAAHRQCILIISAPLITTPLSSVRSDDPISSKVSYLLEHRVNLYVLSNSFFSAPGGFDDSLAEKLGMAATSLLAPTAFEQQYKIVVYTPRKALNRVMTAAAEAGAGRLGQYTHCSFQTEGVGTFIPQAGAHPTIGEKGKLEQVEEVRLEMLVSQRELQGVIAAVLDAHPYEEVAYDLYHVHNPGIQYGRGRVGELPLKVSLDTVIAQVQDALRVQSVRCTHRPEFPISSLAAVSGMCDGLFWNANRAGVGAVVAGMYSLQEQMLADNSATVLIDVGYSASVAPGLKRLSSQLEQTFTSEGLELIYVS